MSWQEAQGWERSWWGNCCNVYGEEEKQLLYAKRMGLQFFHDGKSPYNIDVHGAKVLDIGGGPVSLLLKCVNVQGTVADPIRYPRWVMLRYEAAGIEYLPLRGEDVDMQGFDECWLYNVLQHTEESGCIVANARRAARVIRIFEWIDTPSNIGHPQSLSKTKLDEWLGGDGKVEQINGEANCWGKAYYGIFPT